jgi:hypothetical protein
LLGGAAGKDTFLFRQLREQEGENLYLLIEPFYLPGFWVELDAFGKTKREYPKGILITGKASEERMLVLAGKSATEGVKPRRYTEDNFVYYQEALYPYWRDGLIVALPIGGTGYFYAGIGPNANATQVCIKDSSSLTNGPLTHYTLFSINLEETLRGDGDDTSNRPIAGGVAVGSAKGSVVIRGAAGKKVTVVNLQGRVLSRGTVTSAEAFIVAPSGAAIVSVEGEKATTVIVH